MKIQREAVFKRLISSVDSIVDKIAIERVKKLLKLKLFLLLDKILPILTNDNLVYIV